MLTPTLPRLADTVPRHLRDGVQRYKMQFTEVRRSLKDPKQGSLRTRIGPQDAEPAEPAEPAVLSVAELANDLMRAVVDERKQQSVQSSIWEPLDMPAVRIKKTHKGEKRSRLTLVSLGLVDQKFLPPSPPTSTSTDQYPSAGHSCSDPRC